VFWSRVYESIKESVEVKLISKTTVTATDTLSTRRDTTARAADSNEEKLKIINWNILLHPDIRGEISSAICRILFAVFLMLGIESHEKSCRFPQKSSAHA
jgi:hypothetical protein